MSAIFEDDLQAFLGSSPYALPVTGIYSHRPPQPAPAGPYAVFYRIAPTPMLQHTGPPHAVERLYQISIFGESQSAVLEATDKLRRLMQGYTGLMGSTYVYATVMTSSRYLWEDGKRMHQTATDFRISFKEI